MNHCICFTTTLIIFYSLSFFLSLALSFLLRSCWIAGCVLFIISIVQPTEEVITQLGLYCTRTKKNLPTSICQKMILMMEESLLIILLTEYWYVYWFLFSEFCIFDIVYVRMILIWKQYHKYYLLSSYFCPVNWYKIFMLISQD